MPQLLRTSWRATASTVALLSAVSAGSAHAQLFQMGDVFASVSNGQVKQYRPTTTSGTLVQTLSTGQGGFTTGSAFDGAGNLYVTNFSGNSVSKFNNSGVLQGLYGSGYSTPESIVFDQAGNAYVGNISGGIRKFNAAGVLQQSFAGAGRVDWMDLAADQRTMYITNEGTSVLRYDLVTQAFLSPFATGLGGNAFALRVLGNGNLLVANGGNVLQLTNTGAIARTYTVGGASQLFALNLDPDGTSFWTGDVNSGNLFELNIASGALERTIATGASGSLFGVSVFGEITQGGPPPTSSVPEPGTWALLATGLLAVGGMARRRRPTTA